MGNLSSARQQVEEARRLDPEWSTQEVSERVTDVESRMRRVEEWMKEKEYERCVDELVVCRDACPLWRTPMILLLRCYVELEETEEAFQLANEECAWVENIEESEVTSELEGKDVDEELVRLVLLVFLQRNDQTSVRCLCSRMKTRDTLLWAPLKSLLAFCDACEESERRAVELLSLRRYSEVDEEYSALLGRIGRLKQSGAPVGSAVEADLLTRRAMERYKRGAYRQGCGE